ncbi:MAG: DNA glycosylase, partial [Oscillospiraceae bacterium]
MKTARKNYTITLEVNGPLSLSETLFCGQAFRWKEENGNYTAVVAKQEVCVYIKNDTLFIESDTPLDTVFWQHYFALDDDYIKMQKILCKNDILKKCVDKARGIRVLKQEFFETLISFIISQNNNIPRITGIITRICEEYGEKLPRGQFAFPTPEALACQTVESLGVLRSGFRAKYILDAAQKVAQGDVTREKLDKLDLATAGELLQTIKGVGPKVSDCVLLLAL